MIKTETGNQPRRASFPDPCFLFEGLSRSDAERAAALPCPRLRLCAEGEVVVRAGENGGRLFFLLSGRAAVYRTGGEKTVLMNRLLAGDCFGAASLFTSGPTPTEIVAESDLRLAEVSESSLSRLFLDCPRTALNYIRFISDKLVFLNRRVRDFSAASADEKTACLLLSEQDETGVVTLKNVTALIKTMNLSRASFYRALASFSSRKIIEKHGNAIKIINPNALKGILS